MIKNDPKDFIPKDDKLNGIYRGVIEDNKDPEETGRCKIRIFGVHTESKVKDKETLEGIPTEELPWAEPALGLFEGSISGYGAWTVPLQGSHVFLFFENGHILEPRYFASAPGKPEDKNHGFKEEDGFSDPDDKYPEKTGETDWHEKARGDKYPNNLVFATREGIIIELDNSNEKRVKVTHPSNTYIEIDNNGNIYIDSVNNCNINSGANNKIIANGDTNIESTGNVTVQGAMITLNS